jgi:homoserine kinase
MELLERAQSFGAIGASISGAGPTVLFWTHADTTGAIVVALQRETDGWADVLRAPFESSGAEVREL